MKSQFLFLFPFCLFLLASCVKDKPEPVKEELVSFSNKAKVYVVNEGNFMSGNASVSLYDPGTNSVVEDFYKTQNGTGMGDVAQSMYYYNSDYYLVVNNSNKVVVCDREMKMKASVSGFTSPRYFLPVGNSKAYVSDLYSNSIQVVNLSTKSISGNIPCYGWTEQMAQVYNKVFVCNVKRDLCFVIDVTTNKKTDSISVGPNASSLVRDANDKIWVLSAGNATASVLARLSRINPQTLQVDQYFDFSTGDSPSALCLNKGKDTLFFLNKGIFKMGINSSSLPSQPIVAQGNRNYYGLGVQGDTYRIYASDALDFIQRSNVYIFDMNGNEKSFFKAGTNANGFWFE